MGVTNGDFKKGYDEDMMAIYHIPVKSQREVSQILKYCQNIVLLIMIIFEVRPVMFNIIKW